MSAQEMDLLTGLVTRRSIRRFTEEAVSPAQMDAILYAALCAPSARNRRPFEFVVVQDRDTLAQMAALNPYAPMLGTCAAVIAVCGDANCEVKEEFLLEVCGAATQNILLAIHGQGLGGVWCGVRTDSEQQQKLDALLGLPEGVHVYTTVALGHPDEVPEPRDYRTPAKLHREHW